MRRVHNVSVGSKRELTRQSLPRITAASQNIQARCIRFLEYSTSLFFPVLFALNLHWASTRLYELDLLWLIALAIPLGILGGDLVSGIVHWAADTYCSVDTPVVGPSLVKPFRMHHVYPRDICTHNLVETVGNVCILAFPLLSVCLYLLWLLPESGLLAFVVIVWH